MPDWNDTAHQRLRDLWTEGHSTAEIGRRIGFTKNAIVGKARRLGLPGRPSPIGKAVPRPKAVRAPNSRPMAAGKAPVAGLEAPVWTETMRDTLRTMKANNVALPEMARRLGLSQSTVEREMTRLNLRKRRYSLPPESAMIPSAEQLPMILPGRPSTPLSPRHASPLVRIEAPRPVSGQHKCQWPEGTRTSPVKSYSFTCTGTPVVVRENGGVRVLPYCDDHCAVAYPGWRREAA